jgi:hypothetical protein
MKRLLGLSAAFASLAGRAVSPALAVASGGSGGSGGSSKLFVSSAVENPDGTVTLPLHKGTSHGQTVYYVILDTSNGNLSSALGVNTSQKLANAASGVQRQRAALKSRKRGVAVTASKQRTKHRPSVSTGAVEKVTVSNGVVNFPATIDFSPNRVLQAPNGFPPTQFAPGAVGEPGYSPLIQLPDGTIENAPQIARDQNGDGQITLGSETADKVVSINTAAGTVTYRETNGVQGGKAVKYASFDSSDTLAAALEDVTYAPALNNAPSVGDDSTASARASLAAFVNGQTGATNPQRQGLNSAVADGLDPLNVLRWNPSQGRYSPLWDVHLAAWSQQAINAGLDVRQTDFNDVQGLADQGLITAPDGSPFAASGFIVNCPIISLSN